MRIALFVTCLADGLFPGVGRATVRLLERLGHEVVFPQAPKSGRLEPGYDADIITVTANPLTDIGVLGRPEHITGVWAKGRRVPS